MDWNDLASRKLPSLSSTTTNGGGGGSATQPSNYNRNLSQLHAAGQSLLQSSNITTGRAAAFGQAAAMSQWNTNTNTASVFGTSTAAAQQQQSAPPLRGGRMLESLQHALQRHEQEILDSIVTRTQAEIKESTDARIAATLQECWDADRAAWARDGVVGTRYLGGATATTTSTTTPKRTGVAESPTVRLIQAAPHQGQWGSSFGSSSGSPLDPSMVRAHLEIVQQIPPPPNTNQGGSINRTYSSLHEAIEKFVLVSDSAAVNHNRSSLYLGYTSAWQLTQALVAAAPSSFPVQQAQAALSHFCRQFQIYVTTTVRQATQAGQDTSTPYGTNNDLAAQCGAFAKLKLGLMMDAVNTTTTTVDPAWAVIYYCLRSGDAVAAAEVFPSITTTNVDPAVQRCLTAMAQVQGGAVGIWDALIATDGTLRLDPADLRTVEDLLESANRAETPNIHKIGVYAFLSGAASQPVTSETVEGFKTIEDYLTGALWAAVLQQNPVDELIRLGEVIQNFGPNYFQDPSSGGWSFALPLLATQQYQKALMWLTEAGGKMGLLQATHIGLVLSSAGIVVRNLGGTTDSAASSSAVSSDGTVASLLVAYATELFSIPNAGSLAALEYLVRIPNEVRARKEISKLIANTGDVERLVGTLNAEGMRQGGAIADFYSGTDLVAILVEASNILSAYKTDQTKSSIAVMCLMLAGRYADVLSLMNELLSPPDKPKEMDRIFWIDQSKQFQFQFLSKRTHVMEVLERQDKTSLIRANHILLDLNSFFDRIAHGGSENECFSIAKKIDILPTSSLDRAAKEVEYQLLDELVKDAFPSFLVGVMRILRREHVRLKRNLHDDTSGSVSQRLKEIQEKAKLYTTFAASVGMANEQIGKLNELASLMI